MTLSYTLAPSRKLANQFGKGGWKETYLAGVDEDSGLARADKIRVRPLKRHVPRIAAEEAHHAWGYAILDGTKER